MPEKVPQKSVKCAITEWAPWLELAGMAVLFTPKSHAKMIRGGNAMIPKE
jgi:hypothetical protein